VDCAQSAAPLSTTLDRVMDNIYEPQALTLGLSPLALEPAGGSAMETGAPDPAWRRTLREIAFNLTVGGPSQRPDAFWLSHSEPFARHATGEAKLPLIGSRDPGDNVADYRGTTALGEPTGVLRELLESEEYRAGTSSTSDEAARYQAFLTALRAHPDWAHALLEEHPELKRSVCAFSERAERNFVLALSTTADTYATGFGRDLYTATLIGEVGGPVPLTLNAGVRASEKVHMKRDWECKLGVGTTHRLLARSSGFGALDVTAAGSVLLRDKERESLWLGSLKLDTVFTRRVALTTAVIFTDRPERVGVGSMRSVVGLTYRVIN
jgi:hypothetical protein